VVEAVVEKKLVEVALVVVELPETMRSLPVVIRPVSLAMLRAAREVVAVPLTVVVAR